MFLVNACSQIVKVHNYVCCLNLVKEIFTLVLMVMDFVLTEFQIVMSHVLIFFFN